MYFGKLHLLAAATVAALLVSEGAALPYNYGIGSLVRAQMRSTSIIQVCYQGRMAGDRRAPIGRLVVARTVSKVIYDQLSSSEFPNATGLKFHLDRDYHLYLDGLGVYVHGDRERYLH